MPDENDFEKKHLRNLKRKEREIRKAYEAAINEITPVIRSIKYNGKVFRLKDYPALLNRINQQIKKLQAKVYTAIVNGIEESWDLSNQKNNLLVDKRLAGKTPTLKAKQILYDPNLPALTTFITRKEAGLNLSDRVWSTLAGYKTEMEAVLGVGLSEGKDANSIANGLKRFLNEPDRLFRRVRQDDGTLKLSKAAKEYHPGQGVYRSSFLNAKRVARTETNAAYRNADIERWRTLPFVTAFKINLSIAHPKYDICDPLATVYPLTFNWTSWHPQCLCYLTSVKISDKDFNAMEDEILGIGKAANIKKLDKMPEVFNNYVKDNAERINGWKSQPYWLKFNPKLAKELLK